MHLLRFLSAPAALCGALCIGVLSGVALADESAVVTLTTNDFDQFMENNPVALVEFYAPWCGHCKKLEPEYEKAAKKLKEKEGGIPLAKVDATQEKGLAERFEVRGYPTLKLFRKGKAQEYNGGRTESTIVEWIEKNTGPPVKVVKDQAELDELKKEKSVVFVLTTPSSDTTTSSTSLPAVFEKIADASRDLGTFVFLVDEATKEGAETMTVYRTSEDPVTYSGDVKDESKVTEWAKSEAFPLFGPINGDNYSQYVDRTQDLAWVCMSPEDYEKLGGEVRKAAAKFRDAFSFVHLNMAEFASHAENALGVTEFPALVLQQKAGRYIYPLKEWESDKLASFVQDVVDGKVEKAIKSEPIPATNDEPVKVVVAKNFEEMVFRDDKDVMLEVYAPWCGHCKNLEPIYKELAEKLAGNDHVVIAKLDGAANESPNEDFQWKGFPTIFWVKAGEKKPTQFEGDRKLKDLLAFIKENASKPVEHDEL